MKEIREVISLEEQERREEMLEEIRAFRFMRDVQYEHHVKAPKEEMTEEFKRLLDGIPGVLYGWHDKI